MSSVTPIDNASKVRFDNLADPEKNLLRGVIQFGSDDPDGLRGNYKRLKRAGIDWGACNDDLWKMVKTLVEDASVEGEIEVPTIDVLTNQAKVGREDDPINLVIEDLKIISRLTFWEGQNYAHLIRLVKTQQHRNEYDEVVKKANQANRQGRPKEAMQILGRAFGSKRKAKTTKTPALEFRPDDDEGFHTSEGSLYLGDWQLTNFLAEVESETLRDDGETRERVYRVSGALGGKPLRTVEIPAKDFVAMKWVPVEWGAKTWLAAGSTAKEHAANAILARSNPQERVVYTHTGWRTHEGKPVFLLPGGALGSNGKVGLDCEPPNMDRYKLPDVVDDQEAIRDAVKESLRLLDVGPAHVTAPFLCSTYLAPLASILGTRVGHVLWIHGLTGSFKSCLAALAQSHYGAFSWDHLPGNWESTSNALESQLSRSKDVVFVVDNFIPPATQRDNQASIYKATRLIQSVGDGSDRRRLNSRAEERKGRPPQGTIVATAEILPPSGESTLARCLIARLRPGEVDRQLLTHLQKQGPKFQLAMGAYIKWLAAKQTDERWGSDLQWMLENHREEFLRAGEGHSRHPQALALLHLGFVALVRFAREVGAIDDDCTDIVERVRGGLLQLQHEQPKVEHRSAASLWLSTLLGMTNGGLVKIQGYKDNQSEDGYTALSCYGGSQEVGWVVGECVYLEPLLAYQCVVKYLGTEWRFTETEWRNSLLDLEITPEEGPSFKVFQKPKGKNWAPKRSVAGGRARVYVLDRRVLEESGPRLVKPVSEQAEELIADDENSTLDDI